VNATQGFVIFGDVIRSRRDPAGSSGWLRSLCDELQAAAADDALARFGFTQGDELQGLLRVEADPLAPVLRATLDSGPRRMRWSVALGPIDPGRGPATERTGAAFLTARAGLDENRRQRTSLRIVTGQPSVDVLLDDLGPVLGRAISDLSPAQRRVARLILVDGLRRSEVAERLGVSRATVSVTADRAGVPSLERLARAVRTLIDRARTLEAAS
jgi:predicted DNA-binding protein (UPF0251 family)